jgi:uncharacterized protein YdaU (DUF1376 family)
MSQAFPMHGSRVFFFMAKDPAFLFYPGDWQGGTMHMTHLEKGCYMDLLMLQFNRGKFTLAHAKHMLGSSFDLAWPNIVEKFVCEDGLYWNERLNQEKEKRAKFTESRRRNGLTEKNKESDKEQVYKHMLKHMENENENENIDDNLDSKKNKLKINREKKSEWQDEKKKEYIIQHYPSLLHMQKPITEEQLMNLIAEYGKEAVMKKCEALENKKDAAKKYKSAYMTLKSWLRDFPDIREAKKQSNEDKVKKAMEILQSGTQLIPEFK